MVLARSEEPPKILRSLFGEHQSPWRGLPPPEFSSRCPVAVETLRLAPQFRSVRGIEVIDNPSSAKPAARCETRIEVTSEDSLDAARRLLVRYMRDVQGGPHTPSVAVLNAANGEVPASGCLQGATDQEIELCRRSTLLADLSEGPYPLGNHFLYSPDVSVFKANRAGCYAVLPKEEQFRVSVVSAVPGAADAPDYHTEIRVRTEQALHICAASGHTLVVVPAWGCVSGLPATPKEAAKIMREILRSESFRGRFRHVVFAIPDSCGNGYAMTFSKAILPQTQPLI